MVAAPPKAHQRRSIFAQQLRQLGDVCRDAPRLVACEQVGSRAAAWVILEIYVCQRMAVVVPHDEAGRVPKTEAQLGYKRLIQL